MRGSIVGAGGPGHTIRDTQIQMEIIASIVREYEWPTNEIDA
jgi:hypothetical protein